jgi:hypothetical protein
MKVLVLYFFRVPRNHGDTTSFQAKRQVISVIITHSIMKNHQLKVTKLIQVDIFMTWFPKIPISENAKLILIGRRH